MSYVFFLFFFGPHVDMDNDFFLSVFHKNQICVRTISRTTLPFWLIFWHMIDTMYIIQLNLWIGYWNIFYWFLAKCKTKKLNFRKKKRLASKIFLKTLKFCSLLSYLGRFIYFLQALSRLCENISQWYWTILEILRTQV